MKKVLTTNPEFFGTTEASKLSGLSRDTIIKWCRQHGVGVKVGGIFYVNRELFLKLLGPMRPQEKRQEKHGKEKKKSKP